MKNTAGSVRTPARLVLALIAISFCGQRLSAQDCWRCPDVPDLEALGGCNLHWHAPGQYWEYGCDEVVHTDDLGCAPRWYAMAELMPLWRDARDDFDFATIGSGGPVALSTNNFDDEFQAGTRVLFGFSLGDWYRLEASTNGSNEWSDTVAISNSDPVGMGTGNLMSPFSNFGQPVDPNTDQNEFATIGFTSQMNNIELNLRRRIAVRPGPFTASFLFGGRYMRIDESFNYFTRSSVNGKNRGMTVNAGNDLLGLQIGVMGQYMGRPGWWVDYEIKGAMFANNARQRTFSTLGPPAAANEQQTAYALDMSLMLNWQCSRSITLRIGYYANFMGGLALAANNFQTDPGILASGIGLLDHSGELVYHGPVAGIVGVW